MEFVKCPKCGHLNSVETKRCLNCIKESNELISILPIKYFDGQQIDRDILIKLNIITEHMIENLKTFVKDPITILYNINTTNSNIKWDIPGISELQIVKVILRINEISESVAKIIVNAIQWNLINPAIFIFTNDDTSDTRAYIQLVVPNVHTDKRGLNTVDDIVISNRIWFYNREKIFEKIVSLLEGKGASNISYSQLWAAFYTYAFENKKIGIETEMEMDFESYYISDYKAIEYLLEILGEPQFEELLYNSDIMFESSLDLKYNNDIIEDYSNNVKEDISKLSFKFPNYFIEKLKMIFEDTGILLDEDFKRDHIIDWLENNNLEDVIAKYSLYKENISDIDSESFDDLEW